MMGRRRSRVASPNPKPTGEGKVPIPVKGPIRCHKCQVRFADAGHYLDHKCVPPPPSSCSPFATLPSTYLKDE